MNPEILGFPFGDQRETRLGHVGEERRGKGVAAKRARAVSDRRREGREAGRARLGRGVGPRLGFQELSLPFFYFFSVSFSKSFPNRILKAQIISNQQKSTQKKICLSMNAKACC